MIEDRIISAIKAVSGQPIVHIEQMLGKDVGISGLDGILLAEKVEEMFNLDLSSLIDDHTAYLPASWWDRLRGRTRGAAYTDMRIEDLIEYVTLHAGEGKKEFMPRFL